MASLVIVGIIVASAVWVGVDASQREWGTKPAKPGRLASPGPAGWVVGTLLFWVVIFPLYLVRRNRVPLKAAAGQAVSSVIPAQSGGIAERRTKKCPDCAEVVLAEAKVCKHCKYRFDKAGSDERDLQEVS
jgi:hypothetical protein